LRIGGLKRKKKNGGWSEKGHRPEGPARDFAVSGKRKRKKGDTYALAAGGDLKTQRVVLHLGI